MYKRGTAIGYVGDVYRAVICGPKAYRSPMCQALLPAGLFASLLAGQVAKGDLKKKSKG